MRDIKDLIQINKDNIAVALTDYNPNCSTEEMKSKMTKEIEQDIFKMRWMNNLSKEEWYQNKDDLCKQIGCIADTYELLFNEYVYLREKMDLIMEERELLLDFALAPSNCKITNEMEPEI